MQQGDTCNRTRSHFNPCEEPKPQVKAHNHRSRLSGGAALDISSVKRHQIPNNMVLQGINFLQRCGRWQAYLAHHKAP
eukprot:1138572-Pelagomonas_calceolata.AAC.3